MSYEERAELYADGEKPSDRAIVAVARREGLNVDELHSSEVCALATAGSRSWSEGPAIGPDSERWGRRRR